MALASEDISAVALRLSEGADYADLRRLFPKLTFARCDASDIDATPLRSLPGFDLHLIDSRDHCVVVTGDLASATGLLVARRP
jgi:hypothetical protein